MKITPITQGGAPGIDLGGTSIGRSVSSEKVNRAIQIAQGINLTPSDTPVDPLVEKKEQSIRRITMRTNASPDRSVETQLAEQEQPTQAETPQIEKVASEPESAISETNDVTPVVEDTKPLSPQFAALAKQRRALQAKERELAEREKALTSPTSSGVEEFKTRLKSQPLGVLQELGVTYDQLTEAILNDQSNGNSPEVQSLKNEIKNLREEVNKTLSEKDAQAEQQVLTELRRETERLASEGDSFEMIRLTESYPDVVELIHRTFKESGEILDTQEAMNLIEEELVSEAIRVANSQKVRSRLTSSTPPPQQQPQSKPIKTLTNRDTARPAMDRRSRAILAALGQLGK